MSCFTWLDRSLKTSDFPCENLFTILRSCFIVCVSLHSNFADWSKPEFEAAKAAGDLVHNMDRAPILIVDEKFTVGQSKAIARFVAQRFGFLGSNDIEAAQIDAFCEHVVDMKKCYMDVRIGKTDADLEQAKSDWVRGKLVEWAQKVEKCMGSEGFAVGNKISLADITLHELFIDFLDDKVSAQRSAHCSSTTSSNTHPSSVAIPAGRGICRPEGHSQAESCGGCCHCGS